MRLRQRPASSRHDEDTTLAGRLVFGGLVVMLVLAPWPWGGNTPWAASLMALAAGGLLLLWSLAYATGRVEPPRLSRAARWSLLVWILWLAWIAAQLLPLAPELLAQLSPRSLQYHDRLRGLHADPFYSVSITPGASVESLLDSLMLFGFYSLTLLVVNSRSRIRLLLGALFLAGLLQALYGIHMSVSGMEYGFFEHKKHNIGSATGTFVNRNHFAAYLELAAAAGIGLVLMDLGSWSLSGWRRSLGDLLDLLLSAKFRTRIMLVVLVVAVVLSRSRMGNVALYSAITLAGATYVLLRMRTALIPALLVFLSLALVDLWVVSQWFGLDEVIQRIAETDIETEQRPLVLQDLMPAFAAYGLTGSGLGSFSVAFSPYRSVEIRGFYTHAHNEYAEFLIETGVVGLGILALLVTIHVLHVLRVMALRRRTVYSGAAFAVLMSCIAMLLHSTVEFMLHMPAVAMTWVVLLGLGASMRAQSDKGRRPESVTESVTEVTPG